MPPTKISHTEATRLHRAYRANTSNAGAKETRAVIFDFLTMKELINKITKKKRIEEVDIAFACYYGKYETGDPEPGKCTLIVHFLTKDGTNYTAIPKEIYNFGGARPPMTIIDEQIIT